MKSRCFRNIRLMAFASILLGLGGCASVITSPTDEDNIQGIWKSPDSVAVYEIKMVDGKMTVMGHSTHSGKALQIDEVSWNGKVLEFISHMPSTHFTVYHENRMIDPETMTSTTLAAGGITHTVTWKKTKP